MKLSNSCAHTLKFVPRLHQRLMRIHGTTVQHQTPTNGHFPRGLLSSTDPILHIYILLEGSMKLRLVGRWDGWVVLIPTFLLMLLA